MATPSVLVCGLGSPGQACLLRLSRFDVPLRTLDLQRPSSQETLFEVEGQTCGLTEGSLDDRRYQRVLQPAAGTGPPLLVTPLALMGRGSVPGTREGKEDGQRHRLWGDWSGRGARIRGTVLALQQRWPQARLAVLAASMGASEKPGDLLGGMTWWHRRAPGSGAGSRR